MFQKTRKVHNVLLSLIIHAATERIIALAGAKFDRLQDFWALKLVTLLQNKFALFCPIKLLT